MKLPHKHSSGLDGVKRIVGDKCMRMLEAVDAELRAMKLKEAAKKVEDGMEETPHLYPHKQGELAQTLDSLLKT